MTEIVLLAVLLLAVALIVGPTVVRVSRRSALASALLPDPVLEVALPPA